MRADFLLHEGLVPIAAWLLTYAVHSTLLVLSVLIIERVCRPRSLWLRDSLWKMALVGGVVTATLQAGIGWRPLIGHLTLTPAAETSATSDVIVADPAPAGRLRLASSLRLSGRHAEAHLSIRADRPTWHILPALSRLWLPGLVLCWLIGAAALLCRLVLGHLALSRGLAARRVVQDPAAIDMLAALCAEAGVRRVPRLTFSGCVPVPIARGVLPWRQEICVPARLLTDLQAEEQRGVLAHELSHLLRRDPAWLLIGGLCEAIFFFQPGNRLARLRVQELSEYLCDDWSVARTGRRLVFARCLTEVATWVLEDCRPPLGPLMPAMARPGSELAQRVCRLLHEHEGTFATSPPPWFAPLLGAALLAISVVAPGVHGMRLADAAPVPAVAVPPDVAAPSVPPVPPIPPVPPVPLVPAAAPAPPALPAPAPPGRGKPHGAKRYVGERPQAAPKQEAQEEKQDREEQDAREEQEDQRAQDRLRAAAISLPLSILLGHKDDGKCDEQGVPPRDLQSALDDVHKIAALAQHIAAHHRLIEQLHLPPLPELERAGLKAEISGAQAELSAARAHLDQQRQQLTQQRQQLIQQRQQLTEELQQLERELRRMRL